MVQVTDDSNRVIASYTYGSGNERLISDESGYKTYYVGSMAEYVEFNNSGVLAWNKSYIYLGARLLATLTPNGAGGESTQFHHPDRLGTRLITNATDTSFYEQVSLPYGTALDAESSGATNRRFTSYDRSATTGLDYAVNRHYDAVQGRFTQADPVGMGASSLTDPQSLNMYAYCGGDPINRTDPSGLFWGKLLHRILGRVIHAAIRAVIAAVIGFITGGIHGAIVAGITTFIEQLGFSKVGVQPTPGFNPSAAAVLSSGAGGLNKYIINNFMQGASQQSPCDQKLGAIFGGLGAVFATARDPDTLKHGAGRNRLLVPSEDPRQGVAHIYASATGDGSTNSYVYTPTGYSGQRSAANTAHADTDFPELQNFRQFSYKPGSLQRFGYSGGLVISFIHTGPTDSRGNPLPMNSGIRNASGSVAVGIIGGFGGKNVGGSDEGYVHTHMIFYKAGSRGNILGRIDPRSVFCKGL